MRTTTKPLLGMTASDLMNSNVVRLPEGMAIRDAARLLLQNQISGAPVVDAAGKCIGVLSSVDFLRLAETRQNAAKSLSPAQPNACIFQVKQRTSTGEEVTRCTLPPGVCPVQMQQQEPDGKSITVCNQPHCILTDWQVVTIEKLPTETVRRYMTPDPVTAQPRTSIRALARMMIDAHVHRIIVVDNEYKPIGVVSSTDLLAPLAYDGAQP